MENEPKKTNNIALIIILILIILGLAGYIVYDKVLSKEEPTEPTEPVKTPEVEETTGITEDEEYFNELLYIFLPANSASNFMRNIDSFSDGEITDYLFFYYTSYANKNSLAKYDDNGKLTYNVSKTELDELVYKTFGKKDYKIIEQEGRTGIKKIDDNTYQIYWFASGWSAPIHKISEITNLEDEVIVQYEIMANEENYTEDYNRKDIGTLKFHLTKNEDNYYVTKIEYIENK